MVHLLPTASILGAFLAASLVLCVTPGPGVVYIVTRSLAQGRSAGLASVLGVGVGNLANAVLASVGLAAIFAVSSAAFLIVKYAGATYLVILGIQALLAKRTGSFSESTDAVHTRGRLFADGALVSLMNPKTTLFFAAFVPQFVTARAHSLAQTLMLSVLFVLMALCTDSVYALTSGSLRSRVTSPAAGRLGRKVSGAVLIGLGVAAAASGGSRHPA